jgi:Zn-finger nucleic acid-binding protein
MQCPICSVALTMADRQGIEVDYCPKCRGVWLDRGELDKIIERAAGERPAGPPQADRGYPNGSYRRDDERGHGHRPKYRKRDSLLSELFDF